MRTVAGDTSFTDRIMREDKRTTLLGVAFHTRIVHARELRSTTFHGRAFVRIMAIRAGHPALEHRVSEGQAELGLLVQVALEAGFRRLVGIDNRSRAAAGLDVLAARAVTGLAAHVHRVRPLGLKPGVVGGLEVADDLLMAGRALFGADEGGPRDTGWCHHGAATCGAGDQDQGR